VVALKTSPLVLRYSTNRPSPSARRKAHLAEISLRQVGLRRRSFGQALTPAFQLLSSFLQLNTPTVFCLWFPPLPQH
jgi:hypothetical protein